MTTANLIEIFCILDEFCKFFAPELKKHTIQVPGKRHRNRPSRMSDSEIMTILILFHTHRFRDLKSFYLGYVCQHMHKDFPNPVSYNRFVERQAQVGLHLLLFLQTCALGKCTGISIIDSTPLVSCHIKREKQHKTMKGWAAKGKCTMGWFYGFKLHLVINDKGGDHPVAANAGKRRRQGTAEEQGVYRETLRETLRRQGVYQPGPLRDALR